MYAYWISLICLITSFLPLEATLSPPDAYSKLQEILKSHAIYHELNEEIIKRSLELFLIELDPYHNYLLKPEINSWLDPSPSLISHILTEIQSKNFSAYENMYQIMLKSIERRRQLEEEISQLTPKEDVSPSQFQDMTWAENSEELKIRLHHIYSLQLKTARKILTNQELCQLKTRLYKRRISKEELLLAGPNSLQKQTILTYVLKALSSALDSQTAYFTPKEAAQLMMQVQQRLYGIGAQLKDDLNGLTITRILEDSPLSFHPEIQIGDQIIAVDHFPIIGLDITDAVELIRGPKGSSVTLTLIRKEAEEKSVQFTVSVIRDKIVLKENQFEVSRHPFGSGVIAYLHLHSFYQDCDYSSESDLLHSLNQIKKDDTLKGVVLDLRGNTGGLLPQAVAVAGLFMKQGVVVSIKDNTGFVQKLRNLNPLPAWDGPLVILTNRLTASASEIVAQTLQEYGRAVVVGDQETFGKGTFQTFTLDSKRPDKPNPKGEYKVTRGCYYTVSGKSPQKTGVHVDIPIPGALYSLKLGEQHSKYPLDADTIPPSFYDDLSDIPLMHRPQIRRLYHTHQQSMSFELKTLLPILVKNSEERLLNSPSQQTLLKLNQSEEPAHETASSLIDVQKQESLNILKDLIMLKGTLTHQAA